MLLCDEIVSCVVLLWRKTRITKKAQFLTQHFPCCNHFASAFNGTRDLSPIGHAQFCYCSAEQIAEFGLQAPWLPFSCYSVEDKSQMCQVSPSFLVSHCNVSRICQAGRTYFKQSVADTVIVLAAHISSRVTDSCWRVWHMTLSAEQTSSLSLVTRRCLSLFLNSFVLQSCFAVVHHSWTSSGES